MTAAWLFTVGGGAYAIRTFVWRPWQLLQQNYVTLANEVAQLKQEQALRKVLTPDNETEYRKELRRKALSFIDE